MKILVDKMPAHSWDCLFCCGDCECKISGNECDRRDQEYCELYPQECKFLVELDLFLSERETENETDI